MRWMRADAVESSFECESEHPLIGTVSTSMVLLNCRQSNDLTNTYAHQELGRRPHQPADPGKVVCQEQMRPAGNCAEKRRPPLGRCA